MSITRHRLALGYKAMVLDAVLRHQREHAGALPRKIVFHPNVFVSLLNEIRSPAVDTLELYGVPIRQCNLLCMPYVVTSDGRVQYL